MLKWLTENLANILACLTLGGVVFLSVFLTVRSRKKGKSPCGCSCAQCGACKCCQGIMKEK